MGTIIQSYGPIYGEVVNGTVQGRPNGSVYVPLSNIIELSIGDNAKYVKKVGTKFIGLCTSTGTDAYARVVAQAQDLASCVQLQVSETSEFTTYYRETSSAGLFSVRTKTLAGNATDLTIVEDTTYYVRAQLMASTSVPVATSEVVEVVGVELS